jgi:hypothetical protein
MGLAMCVLTELGVIPVQLAFYSPGLSRQPEQRSWAGAHLEGGAICLQPPPCDKFILVIN